VILVTVNAAYKPGELRYVLEQSSSTGSVHADGALIFLFT
jgi:hypothetical protein